MFYKFLKNLKNRKGFTLIELMTAMTLFLVVMSIISGVFIKSMRTQRMTVALIAANSNAQLTIEQMAREMRTGIFASTPAGTSNSITFVNDDGVTVTYSLDAVNGQILKSGVPITADDVKVNNLVFVLYKGAPGNLYPPRITMSLRVSAPGAFGPNQPVINLQTTVSSRVF